MNRLRSALMRCAISVACLLSAPQISAQEQLVPPRALLVANHLRTLSFAEIVPGIQALKTIASNGTELIALRFSPDDFRFDLAMQSSPGGEWVDDMGKRSKAQVAFNGGFFKISKDGKKHPVGLLVKDKVHYSTAWKKSGGYLVFEGDDVSILQTVGNAVPIAKSVLQTKPVLIEPGGNWAMNTNRAIPKKRTLLCKDNAGDVVVVAIVSGGLSLYEAGWLMRDEDVGGYFDCDSAIAMDGGGSTQIWVKGRPDFSFGGETPVHNGVVIQRQ